MDYQAQWMAGEMSDFHTGAKALRAPKYNLMLIFFLRVWE